MENEDWESLSTQAQEYFFSCPYCGAENSIVFESEDGMQEFISDCEICCQPIQFSVDFSNGHLNELQVDTT